MCHLFEHTWWNVWCGWVSAKFKRVACEVLEVRKRRRRWIGKMLRGGWKTFPRNVINRETTFPPPAANWQMWKYDSTFIGFQIVNKSKLLLRGWSFQCLSIKVLVSWKLWSFPTYTGRQKIQRANERKILIHLKCATRELTFWMTSRLLDKKSGDLRKGRREVGANVEFGINALVFCRVQGWSNITEILSRRHLSTFTFPLIENFHFST